MARRPLGQELDLDADAESDSEQDAPPPPASGDGDGPPDMGSAKIGGTPFNVLMQQAVKLKTHQGEGDRRRWDRLPKFHQNSMFSPDRTVALRQLGGADKLAGAKAIKAEADALLKARGAPVAGVEATPMGSNYVLEASQRYEHVLAVWTYIVNTNPEWKKSGINDGDMELHDDAPSAAEAKDVAALRVACYLNVCRCYHRMADAPTAIAAADAALALDARSDKALLLKAQTLVAPKSHGGVEMEAAIKCLENAASVLDERVAAGEDGAARRQREVAGFLAKLKTERRRQKAKDRRLGGMFDRGGGASDMYDDDERAARLKVEAADAAARAKSGPPKDDAEVSGELSVRQQIAQMQSLLRVYESEGKDAEAAQLRQHIDDAEGKLREATRARDNPGAHAPMDFENPTPAMLADAKAKGIDLSDPRVVAMLTELQDGKLSAKDGESGGGGDDDDRVEDAYKKAEARRMVGNLSTTELKEALCDLDVPLEAGDSHSVLVDKLVDEYARRAEAGETELPAHKPPKRRSVWPLTIGLTAACMLWRMHSLGILDFAWKYATGQPTPDARDLPQHAGGRRVPVDEWGDQL